MAGLGLGGPGLSSLLASAVPLDPAQPVWWLRLSDAAVNLAAVLLLAVMVLRLGDVLLDSDADEARTSRRRSHQLASRWAFVFALLVPLQVIGYMPGSGPTATASSTARSTRAKAVLPPCAAASRPVAPRLSWTACSPPPTQGPCHRGRAAPWSSANSSSARQSLSTPPASAAASAINAPRRCAPPCPAACACYLGRRS